MKLEHLLERDAAYTPSYQEVRKSGMKYISDRCSLDQPSEEKLETIIGEFLSLPKYNYLDSKLKRSLKADLVNAFTV